MFNLKIARNYLVSSVSFPLKLSTLFVGFGAFIISTVSDTTCSGSRQISASHKNNKGVVQLHSKYCFQTKFNGIKSKNGRKREDVRPKAKQVFYIIHTLLSSNLV